MSWPQPNYPGGVIDVGHDEATNLLDQVPAGRRLYTLDEIIGMMSALGEAPSDLSEDDVREWCEGHVEHMATGGYVIGRPEGSA
jgi:hypothetical protein